MSFRYILRYLIDPEFDANARIDELVDFCLKSKVDEVMLFFCAEELSPGHPTESELSAFINLAQRLKRHLDRNHIALSLNPWSTVYHNFRGRTLREGQSFRLMVGETGATSPIAACPLCPAWQDYITRSFTRLVAEIEPAALWIEDDWRLMNHGLELGWGGCFCEEHLRLFSERVGECVNREALLSAILKPGKPHPWRKHWLDLSGETLLKPLQRLSADLRAANPKTRVALMSSSPDAHSAEGRVWSSFQSALGFAPSFITRPAMSPYTQLPALQMPPSSPRLTIANLTGPLEIYPELENSPRCGPYSKSAKYSGWQMINCALIGCDGVTINHYDMMGNGLSLDRAFGRELLRLKPFLDGALDDRIDDRLADGVRVLFSPDVARHLETTHPKGVLNFMQSSTMWADICAILGVAHRYTGTIENTDVPILVSGQTLRAFNDEQLEQLFRGAAILDADSVEIAVSRGFGDLIGIQSTEWISLNASGYSYEEIIDQAHWTDDLDSPRMSAQRCAHSLLRMQPHHSSRTLSRICRYDHAPLWPGCLLFRNAHGGRIASMTYPLRRESQFFMGFFNAFRRVFLQTLIWEMAPSARLAMAVDHPLHCYRYSSSGYLRLAVTNPTDDWVDEITLALPPEDIHVSHWKVLKLSGDWNPIVPSVRSFSNRMCLNFSIGLDYLEGAVFVRQEANQGRLEVLDSSQPPAALRPELAL